MLSLILYITHNMNKRERHYAKWKKLGKERQMLQLNVIQHIQLIEAESLLPGTRTESGAMGSQRSIAYGTQNSS